MSASRDISIQNSVLIIPKRDHGQVYAWRNELRIELDSTAGNYPIVVAISHFVRFLVQFYILGKFSLTLPRDVWKN